MKFDARRGGGAVPASSRVGMRLAWYRCFAPRTATAAEFLTRLVRCPASTHEAASGAPHAAQKRRAAPLSWSQDRQRIARL